jgi:DNA polymerase III psi subunit
MSARNFYQTLYQTDTLFRLADDAWAPVAPSPSSADADTSIDELVADSVSSEPVSAATGFLDELDALTAGQVSAADTVLADEEIDEPVAAPEPVVARLPEPLPQPAPRPTTPSILPPVQQQSRLPRLNHKVLVLADEELDPSNLLFLEKILKAVNLNIDGVDLLNLHGVRDVDFDELLKGKYINHFITFGVPFERINLDIMMDRYSPVRFEGITFLMADSLPTVEADQALKRRLWQALQRVFLQRYN